MIRFLTLFAVLLAANATAMAQEDLNGPVVLQRALAYHDPQGNFMQQRMQLTLQTGYADGRTRVRTSRVDFATTEYSDWLEVDGARVAQMVNQGECQFQINGHSATDEEKEEHNLTCDRAKTTRDYVSYLWGLPMKLQDPGTIVDPVVKHAQFEGHDVLDLRVTYDPEVGTDIWHFYLDPNTYAMRGYAFYKDAAEAHGEIIVLNDEIAVGRARVPKERSWYEMPGRKFLGTDTLLEAKLIPR